MQYLITDEELATGLRLVCVEIWQRLLQRRKSEEEQHQEGEEGAAASYQEGYHPLQQQCEPGGEGKSEKEDIEGNGSSVWWCTHGHDIPWLHFKVSFHCRAKLCLSSFFPIVQVMDTAALLKKRGLGIKEQYTQEHLHALGFDKDARRIEERWDCHGKLLPP